MLAAGAGQRVVRREALAGRGSLPGVLRGE
jgi:hypothetical protein